MTLRTEVRVVEVPVVVRDSFLHAVSGLPRDDFEIYDNGKKQAITAFSVEHFIARGEAGDAGQPAAARPNSQPRPRFLALCFDDLHLLPTILQPVKDAAKNFVRTGLAPGDQVVVVRTSRSENVKFTSDIPALIEEIEKVSAPPIAVTDDAERCPAHFDPHEAYRIAEHMDPGNEALHRKLAECGACYRFPCPEGLITSNAKAKWAHVRTATSSMLDEISSLVDGMAKLPGERIVVLTSGGFLTGTFEADVDRLMEKARHAEVVIDGLDARGLYLNASAGMAYDGMGVLASGTGGTFFHNNNNMDLGFRELGRLPATSYVLGFAPSGSDGKFHSLKVRLAEKKGYSVEARLGYTAAAAIAESATSAASKLDGAAMASDTVADLPATFTWEQWSGPPAITMIVHVDFNLLHFKPNGDRRSQRLAIVAVLSDSHGTFVTGKRSVLELNLKDSTFQQFAKSGFTTALTIKAPPGSYAVRAVAEDAMDGKLAAASSTVEVK